MNAFFSSWFSHTWGGLINRENVHLEQGEEVATHFDFSPISTLALVWNQNGAVPDSVLTCLAMSYSKFRSLEWWQMKSGGVMEGRSHAHCHGWRVLWRHRDMRINTSFFLQRSHWSNSLLDLRTPHHVVVMVLICCNCCTVWPNSAAPLASSSTPTAKEEDLHSRSETSGGSFHSAPHHPLGSQEDCWCHLNCLGSSGDKCNFLIMCNISVEPRQIFCIIVIIYLVHSIHITRAYKIE